MEDIVLKQKTQEGEIELRIIENKRLVYSQKSLLRKQQYSINLDVLDPNPIAYRNVPSRPIGFGGVSGAMALLSLVGALTAKPSPELVGVYGSAIFFGVISAFCFFYAYRDYRDVYIFKNRNNGENILIVARESPSASDVDNFIRQLDKRVNSIRYDENTPYEVKADVYKKHLEFLRQENVLSEEMYSHCVTRVDEKLKKAAVIKLV